MINTRVAALASAFTLALCNFAFAWSECGHHIVALLAYDQLDTNEQLKLQNILAMHPRFEEDFQSPAKVKDKQRWLIGRAGYWPDVARGLPKEERAKYNRPTWHYELGATFVLGNKSKVNVPEDPGPLPDGASLDTSELYCSQAILLCQKVMNDKTLPNSDRAIALCWLAHLIGDIHQPCHAGSLYAADVFPDGDRGANSIKTQAGNLHSLWDGLLGRRYDEGDIRRRRLEILDKHGVRPVGRGKEHTIYPLAWVAQSRGLAVGNVYTAEVLGPIRAVQRGLTDELPELKLSKEYLQNAGELAQHRAAIAAYHLAWAWRGAVK